MEIQLREIVIVHLVTKKAGGLDCGVQAKRLRPGQDAPGEGHLHHGLAAREREIRDLIVHQLLEHIEDLSLVELVLERLARPAFLDAVQAGEVALVRDLPRDVKRRAEIAGSSSNVGGWGMPGAFSGRYAGNEFIPKLLSRALIAKRGEQGDEATLSLAERNLPGNLVPDRHSDTDIGGRLDVSKGWELGIPVPEETHLASSMIAKQQSGEYEAKIHGDGS